LFLIAQRTATSGHSIWTSCSTVNIQRCTIADFMTLCEPNACGGFLRECFVGSKSCLYEFTELNFLSVGSQLPPRTLNILID